MDIKAIKTDKDYREILKEIDSLMDAELNTPEGEKLEVLVMLIEAYEHVHYPLDFGAPDSRKYARYIPNIETRRRL